MTDVFNPWLTTYHVDGELPWQEPEYGYEVPLRIGEGYLIASQAYRRFRVVDIWYSTDRHGIFDLGRHVFLKDVTDTEDDRPGIAAPDYFSA